MRTNLALVAALLVTCATSALADEASELGAVARAWDHAQFATAAKQVQLAEFRHVDDDLTRFVAAHPGNVDAVVWQAITLSSEAGAEGGLGALAKVTRARDLLLQAERRDPNALGDGSIYTSLGSLYAQVPGFPVGFGNREKARTYLAKALSINPTGIEPNYFMADFLVRGGEYARAASFLERAAAAPPRPGREVADAGRHRDIEALLAKVKAHRQ